MADLVNATHKERLSPKNSEPSHLKGGSYETLGGPDKDGASGGDAYKINAAGGIGTDTTIPKSVGAEPTHLPPKTEEAKEPEVSFDGDDESAEVDDLDKELDQFESTEPVDIDVKLGDEDDEKTVKEEDENPFAKKDDEDEKKDELKEDENPFDKFKKKGDGDDDEDDKQVKEELGGEPTHLPSPGQKDGPGGIPTLGEEDDSENPFAKKGEDEKGEKIEEALKIRIKLPQATLFESVNISAKTQKKVGLVFEQVVRDTTKQIAGQVHAHYKRLHEAKLAQRDALMAKQMDSYLSYVTEEWFKANQVAIRSSLRSQLAEEFMGALKKVFVEHYIDVPESKVDVVAKLTEDVQKLRKSLNEQVASKLKLRKLAEAANKARIVAESTRGMSETSAAKLQKLAEDTQYTTAKDFREKVGLLKESYFPKGEPRLTQKLEEDVQEPAKQESKVISADPDIDAIAQTLSRQATQSKW